MTAPAEGSPGRRRGPLQGDLQHLGDCLRQARKGRSREQIESESGVSESQIKRFERGDISASEPPDKLWQLVEFYGWTPDSIRVVLAGGLPRYAGRDLPPLDEDIRAWISQAIQQGEDLTDGQKRRALTWLSAIPGREVPR